MGLFGSRPAAAPQSTPPVQSEDEKAIARYRYLLNTAPPEAIEQAHAEAFAQLTPEQRRQVLQQLARVTPESERPVLERSANDPQALARAATRAEMRQPGVLERVFGGAGAGGMGLGGRAMPGFGGMMAGSLLGSVAGTVLGSAIAHEFFSNHDAGSGNHFADHDFVSGDDTGALDANAGTDDLDPGISSDFGGDFDAGSFDV
jgi:hypothetical protein